MHQGPWPLSSSFSGPPSLTTLSRDFEASPLPLSKCRKTRLEGEAEEKESPSGSSCLHFLCALCLVSVRPTLSAVWPGRHCVWSHKWSPGPLHSSEAARGELAADGFSDGQLGCVVSQPHSGYFPERPGRDPHISKPPRLWPWLPCWAIRDHGSPKIGCRHVPLLWQGRTFLQGEAPWLLLFIFKRLLRQFY